MRIFQKAVTVDIDDVLRPAFNLSDFGYEDFPTLLSFVEEISEPHQYREAFDIVFNTENCGFNKSKSYEDVVKLMSKYIHIDCDNTPEDYHLKITVDTKYKKLFGCKGCQAWLWDGMLPDLISNIESGEISLSEDGEVIMSDKNLTITKALFDKMMW